MEENGALRRYVHEAADTEECKVKKLTRALAVLCALLLTGARAEISPKLDAHTQAYAQGAPYTLTLDVTPEQYGGVDAHTLELLQSLCARAKIVLSAQSAEGGERADAALLLDGQTLLSVSQQRSGEATLLSLDGLAGLYAVTDSSPKLSDDALSQWLSVDFLGAHKKVEPSIHALWTALEPYLKSQKSSTSVRNIGKISRRNVYDLTAKQMTELAPVVRDTLKSALLSVFDGSPALRSKISAFIDGAALYGKTSYRRFLDADGLDIGTELVGQLTLPTGENRKLSWYGGYIAGKGAYLSVKLPAVKGNNTTTLVIDGTTKENAKTKVVSYAYKVTYHDVLDKVVTDTAADIKLKLTPGESADALSGTIVLTRKVKDGDTVQTVYTLTPALDISADGILGTVGLEKKTGGNVSYKLTAKAALAPSEPLTELMAQGAPAFAQSDYDAWLTAHTAKLVRLLKGYSAEDIRLLTHLFHNSSPMSDTAIAAPTAPISAPEDDYLVVEEDF